MVTAMMMAPNSLMRIAWRSVWSIIARVWADTERLHDRFADLRRLGIVEILQARAPLSHSRH
jgi:transposase